MNMNKKLGDNLRFYRKQQGLTLKEMSDKLDITLGTYQKYETGQIKHIDIEIIKKFAKALNVPAAILLNWQEEKETIQKEMINNVLDLFQLDEEKDSELIEELQAKLTQNHIDYKAINDFEEMAKTSKAIELYKLYENADPRIKAAIDSLLKGQQ